MATIGDILKAERLRAGGSIETMARLCGYSRSHLANIEDGRKNPTRHVVVAYAEVYPDVRNRREIIAYLAAGAVAAPAVLALDLDAALAAEATGARNLEDWAGVVHTRAADYMSIARVPEVRSSLYGDLTAIRSGAASPRRLALISRMATLYGQTQPLLTDEAAALRWFELGIGHADASADREAQVWARARAAQVIESTPHLQPTARRWADEAVAIAGGPSTGLVWAHLTRAVLAARSDGDLLAELDAADRALDRAGVDAAGSDYDIAWWRHQVRVSGILAGVGHPCAAAIMERAAAALPASQLRYAVHLDLHRAAIDHDAGDRAGAVQRAEAAVDQLPAGQRSVSIGMFLDELRGGDRPRRPIVLKRRW